MTTRVDDVASGSDHQEASTKGTIGGSRAFAWLLVITGAAGSLAAWVITLDSQAAAKTRTSRRDPASTPSCPAGTS